ncbi:MAG TPA: N-acetyltransferase, partial [Psychrobacter sp.]|nr:N-acetyltransferase [Psychrobacter sp.]
MSDVALDVIATAPLTHQLTQQFMVQRASKEDLAEVLAIYNQSIPGKQATANLALVTLEERTAWFDEHLDSPTRPIYVVKALLEGDADRQSTKLPIVAWGSFSDLYARTAYHI